MQLAVRAVTANGFLILMKPTHVCRRFFMVNISFLTCIIPPSTIYCLSFPIYVLSLVMPIDSTVGIAWKTILILFIMFCVASSCRQFLQHGQLNVFPLKEIKMQFYVLKIEHGTPNSSITSLAITEGWLLGGRNLLWTTNYMNLMCAYLNLWTW